MSSSLSDFDIRSPTPQTAAAVVASLSKEAEAIAGEVTHFINHVLSRMTTEQAQRLIAAMDHYQYLSQAGFVHLADNAAVVYDENFDLKKEIARQITAVRALQDMVLIGNRVREGITAREVKDTVATASSMIATLMKYHEELLSLDRRRAVEQATIEVLQELGGDETVDRFVELMERRLAIQ